MRNQLAALRKTRGLSASQLAQAAGCSRQTIYAIEAASFVPNTAVALRLARILETSVEELFPLDEEPPPPRTTQASVLPGSEAPHPGQPVRLCRVDQRLFAVSPAPLPWYFPASDGVVARSTGRKTRIQLLDPAAETAPRILIAGCDPAISVLARHARSAGIELALAHRNSSQALHLLKEGSVHLAGTHLRDETSGESNLPAIARIFPRGSVAAISYAVWEEGIVTARRNPKAIRGIDDFARRDIAIVNREPGAGSRRLLDARLHRLGIAPANVRGYDTQAPGHLAAAAQVHSGAADCCIATRAAARLFGLHFIPLVTERYDLVIRRHHLGLPAVETVLDILCRSSFRRELGALGGYDTAAAGERIL